MHQSNTINFFRRVLCTVFNRKKHTILVQHSFHASKVSPYFVYENPGSKDDSATERCSDLNLGQAVFQAKTLTYYFVLLFETRCCDLLSTGRGATLLVSCMVVSMMRLQQMKDKISQVVPVSVQNEVHKEDILCVLL